MGQYTEWKYWIASITDTCSNRCPGCYRVLQNNLSWEGNHMSLPNFKKILTVFVEQGGESIDFVGGEPTLHPQFLQMVNLCVGAGIKIWIYTNLREFGRRTELAEQILNLGGDITIVGKLNVPDLEDPIQRKFQIKLIGASGEAVDEMWQGLQNLLVTGFSKGKIGIENLVRRINIDFAPQVYKVGLQRDFFVDLEIPTCPVATDESSFRRWLKFFPTKEQILACIKEVAKINEHYGIPQYVPIMPHLTGRNPGGVGTGCVAFKQAALLTEADGRLGLCSSGEPLVHRGRQLNILNDSLEVTMKNDVVKDRRYSCNQGNIHNEPCRSCEYWKHCLGGCAALRETLGLTYYSYPLCYMHEWTLEEELLALFRDKRNPHQNKEFPK